MATNKEIVDWIKEKDPRGAEALWIEYERLIRFSCRRRMSGLSQELEDTVHNVYVLALEALSRNGMRDPDQLPNLVITISKRSGAQAVRVKSMLRKYGRDVEQAEKMPDLMDLEAFFSDTEKLEIVSKSLNQLKPLEQQILVRFYLMAETREAMESNFGMTETQFRLYKSRALAKFGANGRMILQGKKAA